MHVEKVTDKGMEGERETEEEKEKNCNPNLAIKSRAPSIDILHSVFSYSKSESTR